MGSSWAIMCWHIPAFLGMAMPHRSMATSMGSLPGLPSPGALPSRLLATEGGMKPQLEIWVNSSMMFTMQIVFHFFTASMQTSLHFCCTTSSALKLVNPPLFTIKSRSGSLGGTGNLVMQSLTSESMDLSSSTWRLRTSFCSLCSSACCCTTMKLSVMSLSWESVLSMLFLVSLMCSF